MSSDLPIAQSLARQSRSLADLAYEELRRRIASGDLAPGARVVIASLADEFGMSLIPVREALARLHAERLVTFEKNKGYRVGHPPDPLELEHLFSARLMLECGALEVAIVRVSQADLDELARLNRQMADRSYGVAYDDYIAFVRLNAAFHSRLIDVAGNPFISRAYRDLGYEARISQTLHGRGVPDIDRLVSEHARVIEGLRSGSLEAARRALRRHILDGARRMGVLQALKEPESFV